MNDTTRIDQLTATLLILAGAAAPGAAFTYQLGTYGFLGAACFVLTLIYIVHKNLPDASAPTTDEAPAMPYAATGPTERLDERFPEVYARDVADGQDTRHSSVWLIRRYSSYSVAHQEAVKRPYN